MRNGGEPERHKDKWSVIITRVNRVWDLTIVRENLNAPAHTGPINMGLWFSGSGSPSCLCIHSMNDTGRIFLSFANVDASFLNWVDYFLVMELVL